MPARARSKDAPPKAAVTRTPARDVRAAARDAPDGCAATNKW